MSSFRKRKLVRRIVSILLTACLLTGCSTDNSSLQETVGSNISVEESFQNIETSDEETESDSAINTGDIPADELQESSESVADTSGDISDESLRISGSSGNSEKASENGLSVTPSAMNGTMEVHFIDVGQADATLILCDGHAVLIDAGENEDGVYLQNYLRKQGVETIDLFVITHFDSDHCGGADVIITKFDIDDLLVSDFTKDTATCRDVFDAISYKGYSYSTPSAGDTYQIGDMEITIIAPAYSGYTDANNASIGLIVRYGSTSFLFTGDCEEEAETAILKTGIDLKADVYQAGHHGSRTSSSTAFLEAVNPAYAVISCGEGNSYGHPHAATLNSLRMMGVQVFRTDEQGTIVAYSDGESITWNCSPSESWQSGEQTQSDQEDTPAAISSGTADGESDEIYYIGNSNTMKFHYSYCSSVSQMAEKNKVDLSGYTRDQITEMGYSPCGNCKP